jgi:hypothetical protein
MTLCPFETLPSGLEWKQRLVVLISLLTNYFPHRFSQMASERVGLSLFLKCRQRF